MGGKRMLWGDVNAALNRLVAKGVIAAFKSNFDCLIPDLGLHVHVTPVRPVTDLEARRFVIASRARLRSSGL